MPGAFPCNFVSKVSSKNFFFLFKFSLMKQGVLQSDSVVWRSRGRDRGWIRDANASELQTNFARWHLGSYPTGGLPSVNTAFWMPLGSAAKYWRSHHPPALPVDALGHRISICDNEPVHREILRHRLCRALPVTSEAHARSNAQQLLPAGHSYAATPSPTPLPKSPCHFVSSPKRHLSAWHRHRPHFPHGVGQHADWWAADF